MYENIDIVLGTKHKKEEAIRDPFHLALGAKIHVPDNYDTDKFGTFTGEVLRTETPYETVIKKAKEAAMVYGYDYAIANEGSFGPHPAMFFVPADIELISFIDHKNGIVVVESEITPETNYAHHEIRAGDDYREFLRKIKFGSHGLIARSTDDNNVIAKGITTEDVLFAHLQLAFRDHDIIRLETDMRAMMNPTRMQVINKLAVKLVNRLKATCRACRCPGFGKISVKGNLSCDACGAETELYQYKVFSCVKCDYEECCNRDDGLTNADPQYCPYCNP